MVNGSSLTVTTQPAQSTTTPQVTTWDATYKWLLGWAVSLVILTLLNKTRLGHVAIYYWLWGLILFLVVTQYKFIVQALGPLGQPAPGGQS